MSNQIEISIYVINWLLTDYALDKANREARCHINYTNKNKEFIVQISRVE